jgi:hypothetical protein
VAFRCHQLSKLGVLKWRDDLVCGRVKNPNISIHGTEVLMHSWPLASRLFSTQAMLDGYTRMATVDEDVRACVPCFSKQCRFLPSHASMLHSTVLCDTMLKYSSVCRCISLIS